MDFTLDPRHTALRRMLRDFCDQELRPRAEEVDRTGQPDPAMLRWMGELHGGWRLVLRAFNRVRLSLAAAGLGAAEGALDLGVKFAVERKQFGVPIAQKQAIQNYVADCAVDIEALRHQVQYAAWLADTGQPDAAQSSIAKVLAARVARDTANKMLQVHGGCGFSDEYSISRVYRDVRGLRLLGGTDEIQRYAVARGIFDEHGLKIQP